MIGPGSLAYDLTGLTVPLIALFAFILPLVQKIVKHKLFPGLYALVIMLFTVFSTTTIYYEIARTGKPIVYAFGGWPPPLGISYEVDAFNGLLGMYAAWILLGVLLFSLWYNHNLDEPEWYYTLLLGLTAGALGCFYTGDVFNLFVMLEVLSISVYGLIAYYKNNPGSLEAAMKYGIIGATATTIYFIGLMIIYGSYGSLNMADILSINVVIRELMEMGIIGTGFILAATLAVSLSLWVFTFKAGLFPNHFWLPDAYCESPTPVAAALSGVSEIVGVYAAIRFLYTVFPSLSPIGYTYRSIVLGILLVLGFLGGVIGALMMLVQRDIKRLLAYSSVSHIGLMFMIASIAFVPVSDKIIALGFTALLVHIIAHGISKLLLFSASEVFIEASGTKIMDDMRGIGRKYPLVSMALIAGFLNLMGAIPFLGFYSKLLMYQTFIEAGQVLPAIGIVVISAISILGYAKAIYSLVLSAPVKEQNGEIRVGAFKYFLALLAIILLITGIIFPLLYSWIHELPGQAFTLIGLEKYHSAYLEVRRMLWG
ncbi:MAG: proton-conducting transporter membrane subunit [Thermoprotei archaeon]